MTSNKAVCLYCGNEFKRYSNRQEYCGSECYVNAKIDRDLARNKMFNYVDNYNDDAEIYISENKRRIKPNNIDIQEVLLLLKDFNIKVDKPPTFNTYAELDIWRSSQIRAALA